ncbi:hypothetical protein BGX38DRAFT_725907 [Terfezia claveryi]|nr:hypothetical protein BGX38DRAFT_725907 [Terfezia claveryi]
MLSHLSFSLYPLLQPISTASAHSPWSDWHKPPRHSPLLQLIPIEPSCWITTDCTFKNFHRSATMALKKSCFCLAGFGAGRALYMHAIRELCYYHHSPELGRGGLC